MKVAVNPARCPQNHRCPAISACPIDAISQKTPYDLPVIDAAKCTVCGKCVRYCPMGAFEQKPGDKAREGSPD